MGEPENNAEVVSRHSKNEQIDNYSISSGGTMIVWSSINLELLINSTAILSMILSLSI